MKLSIRVLLLSASVAFLGGCSIHEKIENDKNDVAQVKNRIKELSNSEPKYERVTRSSTFYVPPLTQIEAAMPSWYFKKVDSAYSSVPFYLIVTQLLRGQAVTPNYNELTDADKMSPITIAFNDERLGEALQSLAKSSGYSLSFEGDSVTFNKFEERTFTIATLPGMYNSQIGNDGEATLSGSTNDATTAGTSASMEAGSKQFSSLSMKDKSIILELKKALDQIKTEQGKIEVSETTQNVFVKDRPANVSAIAKVIANFNSDLTKTISLDIRFLDVIYTTNNRSAFDSQLSSKLLSGKAVLKSTGQAFIAGSGTTPSPSQFDLSVVGGDFDGTKLFIDALQKQADISRQIQVPVEAINGSMSKVMSVENTMFVAEQYGNNATTGGVLTGGGARQETLQTGQIFNVFAKAVGDDVIFKINASISAKLDIKKKSDEATGLYLESPETTAMIFDQSAILENGVTRIITGINATNINVSDSNAGYDVLGFSRTSETARKETIMLVTARITRGLKVGSNQLEHKL
jgi:hypothetical protein